MASRLPLDPGDLGILTVVIEDSSNQLRHVLCLGAARCGYVTKPRADNLTRRREPTRVTAMALGVSASVRNCWS